MKFEEILADITPKIRSMAEFYSKNYSGLDSGDLMQEMSIHLYKMWRSGEMHKNNASYIYQSCWYFIKNHIRKSGRHIKKCNADIDRKDDILEYLDKIPDPDYSLNDILEYNNVLNNILAEDLTDREKEVFKLSMEGHTTREIGRRFAVSNVMVFKIIRKIRKKFILGNYI